MTASGQRTAGRADDDRQRLVHAELLVNSPDPEERRKGLGLLGVLSASFDLEVASRAQALLASQPGGRNRRPRDAEFDLLMNEWTELRSPVDDGPLDARFANWFSRAEARPDLLHRLAPRMVDTIGRWLTGYRDALMWSLDEARIGRFEEWVELARRYPGIARTLQKTLADAMAVRSERRFTSRATDIERALREGDVKRAWSLFDEIETSDERYRDRIVRLSEAIDGMARLQSEVVHWRATLPAESKTASDIAHCYDVFLRGKELLQSPSIPQPWMNDVQAGLDQLESTVIASVERRAAGCQSLQAFREAIRDLDSVRAKIEERWLMPLGLAMTAALRREAETADSPAALLQLSRVAATWSANLPAAVARELLASVDWLEALASAWSHFESAPGAASLQKAAGVLSGSVAPLRFRKMVQEFSRLSLAVDTIRLSADRPGSTAERIEAFEGGIAELQPILAETPAHAGASELLITLREGIEHLQLDAAIEAWDVKTLRIAAGRGDRWEEPYAALLMSCNIIEQLAELRLMPADPSDLAALATWWELWRELESQLPSVKPDSSRRALQAVRDDVAAAVRSNLSRYLNQLTTLFQDQTTEGIVAPIASDLQLDGELVALTRRRQLQEAVRDAQVAGTRSLALVLRDQWGLISRYFAQSATLLADAVERAWDEADGGSLALLREVIPRVLSLNADPRLEAWSEWLGIEESLSSSPTPEAVARLQPYLRDDACDPVLTARLGRLTDRWRSDGDWVVLAWAYRVFSAVDMTVMPGSDPSSKLTEITAAQVAALIQACREAETVDLAFVEVGRRTIAKATESWERLEKLMLSVSPRHPKGEWPSPPVSLANAATLLSSIQQALNGLATLQQSDLRAATRLWDQLDRQVRRQLEEFRFAKPMRAALRRAEPLTKLKYRENKFGAVCDNCRSPRDEALDELDVFGTAARLLEEIAATFQGTDPEGAATWIAVCREYWQEVPRRVGDRTGNHPPGDLDALVRRLFELEENERVFQTAMKELWRSRPSVSARGIFSPEEHLEYLELYPKVVPLSVRVMMLFHREAQKHPHPIILRKSRRFLPDWLKEYVDATTKGQPLW